MVSRNRDAFAENYVLRFQCCLHKEYPVKIIKNLFLSKNWFATSVLHIRERDGCGIRPEPNLEVTVVHGIASSCPHRI